MKLQARTPSGVLLLVPVRLTGRMNRAGDMVEVLVSDGANSDTLWVSVTDCREDDGLPIDDDFWQRTAWVPRLPSEEGMTNAV